MIVTWIERKGGRTKVTRVDLATGKQLPLKHAKRTRAANNGYWQRSVSCGVPLHQVNDAKKLDNELGVSIDYDKMGRACFDDAPDKRSWMRAHHYVDHDAGYKDPCPGDFGFGER